MKRALSSNEAADFRFDSDDLTIAAEVSRDRFESWIAPDLARIAETVDEALASARLDAGAIDHVFLTGGSSLIPALRRIFEERFGADRIATGDELTSIAHGLALIGAAPDLADWSAPEETQA